MSKAPVFVFFLVLIALATAPVNSQTTEGRGDSENGRSDPRAYLVVTFDVEDYISPESERIDDIPKWLAEIMTEEGVTGTFFVIGEKARSLEKRGRKDVIAAMAKHDIGSHTNFGSIHPTVTEQLEKAGWAEGVGQMLGQESAGIRELERIFRVPVRTLARHGGSYGPQLVNALGTMDVGYQGSPARLPGHDIVWFANALNFSAQYGYFDDTYYRDDLFEPAFEKLKADLPGLAKKTQVIALFCGHPTKIRAEEFWDLNFYYGKNTPETGWITPRLRPAETMATAQKNFRRMMRWLKGRDDIVITNYRTLMPHFERQKETVTAEELAAFAAASLKAGKLAPDGGLSPAEAFAALAWSVSAVARSAESDSYRWHLWKFQTSVVHPLGPMEVPPAEPEVARVKRADVYRLAAEAGDFIGKNGSLPSSLSVDGRRIGAGSLFALFSTVYLDAREGTLRPEYDVPAFEPYPMTNEAEIIKEVEGYKTWPVHRRDLDMSKIVELTRLQLWTLKPATRTPRANT